jgi:alanine-glyoxylate transaminase / serine-glyoxylate transaminase / serine-pyruvate transaminase
MVGETLKLMIPGPIQPAQDVLDAMGRPVQAHYGPAWRDYYNDTLEILRKVFNTQGNLFIMVGSGTAAIDACLGSAFSDGESLLVGMNGFFGDRLKEIAESYNIQVIPVTAPWGQPLRAEDFRTAFKAHPEARAAATVHLETSTTIVNPIQEIGAVCREFDAVYFVDAVSSLGGLPVKMDEWGISLMASASQKCLGAPPGLAPVAVAQRGWQAIDRNPHKGHGWYGDLRVWQHYAVDWGDWHPTPITMATNNVVALHTSLESLMAEGIESRMERYRCLAMRLRDGLRRIGLQVFTPDEIMSPVLTAAYVPEGVTASQLVQYLTDVHKIKISTGLGEFKEKMIRIGHMSPTTSDADIDEVVQALSEFH